MSLLKVKLIGMIQCEKEEENPPVTTKNVLTCACIQARCMPRQAVGVLMDVD